jgi:hypothetical protein
MYLHLYLLTHGTPVCGNRNGIAITTEVEEKLQIYDRGVCPLLGAGR